MDVFEAEQIKKRSALSLNEAGDDILINDVIEVKHHKRLKKGVERVDERVRADRKLKIRDLSHLPDMEFGAKLIYRINTSGMPSHDDVLIPKIRQICGIAKKFEMWNKLKGHKQIVHESFGTANCWKFQMGNGWKNYCICNKMHGFIRLCSFVTKDEKLYYFQIGGTCYSYISDGDTIDYASYDDPHLIKDFEQNAVNTPGKNQLF